MTEIPKPNREYTREEALELANILRSLHGDTEGANAVIDGFDAGENWVIDYIKDYYERKN